MSYPPSLAQPIDVKARGAIHAAPHAAEEVLSHAWRVRAFGELIDEPLEVEPEGVRVRHEIHEPQPRTQPADSGRLPKLRSPRLAITPSAPFLDSEGCAAQAGRSARGAIVSGEDAPGSLGA